MNERKETFFQEREEVKPEEMLRSKIDEIADKIINLSKNTSAEIFDKEKQSLINEYRRIIEKARKIQDTIDKERNDLPVSLILRLYNKIKQNSGIICSENGEQDRLKYNNWYEAVKNSPENRAIYEMRSIIENESDVKYLAVVLRGNNVSIE